MKKTDYILIGVVALILVLSIFCIKGNAEKTIKEKVTLEGEAGFHEVTYAEYTSHLADGKPFIIVFEKTGCHYCELYMPIVEEVVNEKSIPVYYLNVANISEEEFAGLSSTNDYFKSNNEWGTPTTLLLNGEKTIDSIGGYVEKEELESFLDKNVVLS